MNIVESLKKGFDIRLSSGNRWLVWNEIEEAWIVYERKYYGKKVIMICRTSSEEEAMKCLTGE